jgi:hypothetical protein
MVIFVSIDYVFVNIRLVNVMMMHWTMISNGKYTSSLVCMSVVLISIDIEHMSIVYRSSTCIANIDSTGRQLWSCRMKSVLWHWWNVSISRFVTLPATCKHRYIRDNIRSIDDKQELHESSCSSIICLDKCWDKTFYIKSNSMYLSLSITITVDLQLDMKVRFSCHLIKRRTTIRVGRSIVSRSS